MVTFPGFSSENVQQIRDYIDNYEGIVEFEVDSCQGGLEIVLEFNETIDPDGVRGILDNALSAGGISRDPNSGPQESSVVGDDGEDRVSVIPGADEYLYSVGSSTYRLSIDRSFDETGVGATLFCEGEEED